MKHFLLIFLVFLSIGLKASSTFYPWSVKLDNKIEIKSTPYRIYDTSVPGETKVYKDKQLLYSIDKYLSGKVLTDKSGEFLVEINFFIYKGWFDNVVVDSAGNTFIDNNFFKGNVINIYKNGILQKEINFEELSIDTAKVNRTDFYFNWNSSKAEFAKSSFLIVENEVKIFSVDNQIITIDLNELKLSYAPLLSDKVKFYSNQLAKIKRKVWKKGFPEKFTLPLLDNGTSLENSLAENLGKVISDYCNDKDASIRIYVHTLLINKSGVCESCYVSTTHKNDTDEDFGYNADNLLKDKIESWLLNQKYQVKEIPKFMDKFGFSNFIYLK